MSRAGAGGSGDSGDAKAGFKSLSRGLSMARVHTAARSIGLARGALEDAVAYAQQRRQFDQPIGDFQAIRFKIAHMASEVEACRALMYQVAADAVPGIAARRRRLRPLDLPRRSLGRG